MPNDTSFKSTSPGLPFDVRENVGSWQGKLAHDLHFKIEKTEDANPPIIVWQKFVDLNTIEVNFSEELHNLSATKLENYVIEDLNHANDQKDSISIIEVEKVENSIYLKTEGITEASEERYSITFKDAYDKNFNYLEPTPMTVTLVQRFEE